MLNINDHLHPEIISIPHGIPFDPTFGHTPEDLGRVTMDEPEPDDFVEFWEGLAAKAKTVPLDCEVEELPSPKEEYRLLLVHFTSYPDYRVGAWAVVPRDLSLVKFGVVVSHGYGGRSEPEWGRAGLDRVVIYPVAPGFQISADPRLPENSSWEHVITGIENRDDYILGACAAEIWRSLDVLEYLVPGVALTFHYIGGSFGGGMGALMLPWEPRFESAEIVQPTFGSHTFRLQGECQGSGEAVRRHWLKHPEIRETLRYFDAVFSARHMKAPVVFGCSMFDPCVPPPGQFAVVNAHPGPKRVSRFLVGHFAYEWSGQEAENAVHQQNLRELIGDAAFPVTTRDGIV